jgi:hypothetical protein
LSEERKIELKNANIGIAVSALVLIVGFMLFRSSEGAMEALAIGAFAAGMAVLLLLDRRDERTHDKEADRSP